MADLPREPTETYESPALVELGAFADVTLCVNKDLGAGDGFMFQGNPIHCMST